MPTDRVDDASTVTDVVAETLAWNYVNSGAWASATGQVAGTIVVGKLKYTNILNSLKSAQGSYNDTSFSLGAATRFDTRISVPEIELAKLQFISPTDQAAQVALWLVTQGYYCVDHRRGVIWGIAKAVVASDAASYSIMAPVAGASGPTANINIDKEAGSALTAANTSRSAADKVLLVQTIDSSGNVGSASDALADYSPGANGIAANAQKQATVDGDQNTKVRGPVLTDEGSFRFSPSGALLYVACGTGFVFTNGSTAVTSDAAFGTYNIKVGDYIKLSTDTEASYAQIASIVGTTITLTAAYAGTGGTGICWKSVVKPTTGSGGTIAVASGVCTLASGTTDSAVTSIERYIDYCPINGYETVSISQRIANQTIYIGKIDPSATPKYWARFLFNGTDNTKVICETAYSNTTTPSASETNSQTVTLPNSLTSATLNKYRTEVLPEGVAFYVGDVQVAFSDMYVPSPYDIIKSYVSIANGTSAAGTTTVTIAGMFVRNYDIVDLGRPQKQGIGLVSSTGIRADLQGDSLFNLLASLNTAIRGEDSVNDVMKTQTQASYTDIAASALIKTGEGQFFGFIVNSASAGATVKVFDNTANSGTVLLNTITLPAVTTPQIISLGVAAKFVNGLYVTIAVAAADVTLFWN